MNGLEMYHVRDTSTSTRLYMVAQLYPISLIINRTRLYDREFPHNVVTLQNSRKRSRSTESLTYTR